MVVQSRPGFVTVDEDSRTGVHLHENRIGRVLRRFLNFLQHVLRPRINWKFHAVVNADQQAGRCRVLRVRTQLA